jgi:Zn finger protein HypA/HybF involved in hydrogenase expression
MPVPSGIFSDEENPHWRCTECNHVDHEKPMPEDREKFYKKEEPGYSCPKCKSHACFVPVGF